MKRTFGFVLAALLLSVVAYAHGDKEHIQGTVTQISAKSITVQLANKTTKTVTVQADTAFKKSGKKATLQDLQVGDRVVIDVDKGKLEAEEVQFGPPAAKKAPGAAAHAHKE